MAQRRLQINTIWILLAVCVMSGGCVRRRLTFRTNPSGALVYVDKQFVGTTPVSTNITYYGTRVIDIVKDGYRSESVSQKINPPWYQIPPLDFVTENLTTHEFRDERVLEFQLVPQPIIPPNQVRERAESLRTSVRQGHLTPLAPVPFSGIESSIPAAGSTAQSAPSIPNTNPVPPVRNLLPRSGIPLELPAFPSR